MNSIAKCPSCDLPISIEPENEYRPFCSERCKMMDLGSWLEEKYAITDSDTTTDETSLWQKEQAKH